VLTALEEEHHLDSEQQLIAKSLLQKLSVYHSQMGNTVLMASVNLELIKKFTLNANEAYDEANKEFLHFMEAVQEDIRTSVGVAQQDLNQSEYHYLIFLCATFLFIVAVSIVLATLFTKDMQFLLGLVSKLSSGYTDINIPLQERKDEFGAINKSLEVFKNALVSRKQMEVDLRNEITERTQAEDSLRVSKERYRVLFEDNPLMLISIDPKGRMMSTNRRCEIQLGFTESQLAGLKIYHLMCEGDEILLENLIRQCMLDSQSRHQYTLRMRRLNGDLLWFRVTAKLIEDEGENFILLACEDVTETRVLTEKLSWQATHDNLTGLINRWEFENRLASTLETAKRDRSEHVLCFLDLDQFKIINDTCGHSAGDELLKQVSALLKSQIRARDTLARLGGDEFGVLLEYCGLESGKRTAKNLLAALEGFRFSWSGQQFRIGVSIGLICIDSECEHISELMMGADAACYAAKEQGRNRMHVYTESDQQLAQRHGEMQWAARIPEALENNLFELYYQDIFSIHRDSKKGRSIEILVRMRNGKTGEIIPPSQFLPAAERYNFAERLDRWVISKSFETLYALEATQFNIESFGINLSGSSLGNHEFLDFVLNEIKRTRVRPQAICFEITETAAISNINSAQQFILRLKQEGVCFALDDFGTGLSSFAYLHNLPVDYLKIDGMFIRDIVSNSIQYAMVKSINEIGHLMGMQTIAECVETREVMRRLEEIGVDYCQGYYIAVPRPLSQLNYLKNVANSRNQPE
jgi:diguanylate cyclase (GGDEF)-like protein/PAS domain S-box-containing protein